MNEKDLYIIILSTEDAYLALRTNGAFEDCSKTPLRLVGRNEAVIIVKRTKREIEKGLLDVCGDAGIACIPYNPKIHNCFIKKTFY